MFRHLLFVLPAALLFAGLVCCSPATAAELTIHYHERPPYYVTGAGGMEGIIGERVSRVMAEAGLDVSPHLTPAKRQLQIIKDNNGMDCIIGWFLTPRRQQYAQYSKAIYQDRPMVVLTREDNPAFRRSYTLEELIVEPGLTMLMKDGYSYGLVIDFMIDQHRPKTLLTTTESTNMVRMIHAGRADYMLLACEEVDHVIKAAGLPRNAFKAVYPTGMPPFNKRYLLFSKRVPQAVIDRVNRAIDMLYPQKD